MYSNKYLYCSLYIHIPWCIKKCYYCDFYSLIYHKDNKKIQKKYIDHLIIDLKNELLIIKKNIYITSIFFGGGTPSLIETEFIQYFLYEIKKLIYIPKDIEISMEMNPTLLNIKNIIKYSIHDINRISIGVQSFNNQHLKNLGRIHSNKDVYNTIYKILKYKSFTINLDLIYGLPNQTIKDVKKDLNCAINIFPEHISWYQLTIEKNTLFGRYQPKNLPNNDILWKMFISGKNILKKYNYLHYEISSFAKNKLNKCKHNLNYWYNKDYLGLGCASHSKITNNNKIIRTIRNKSIKQYINGNYVISRTILKTQDKIFEFFLNRTRLLQNIKKEDFIKTTGLKLKYVLPFINQAIKLGYMRQNDKYWIITNKGYLFLNNLLEIFI
ncbi:radical SAM family heme chaperone HemW [Enterobacteriaceae endosymbiont of Neohaemonia nigricornis]|uniref:radical SAM family heme chaperone HemW n=1 Tax=Enterobacteriaceae endosymbiont of Neohaemonia nigricornis TaxID=2675792 RepID=UPI001448DC76|nr:radical SAM family heme chaperone HemW [Enterobacteriaceae endosymbiont of Neohaemonia nigricornis]QJC30474.1 radical SAM family heme chaperone HemW [Enterobacteriaceae endosymbiont of Neohaemonia nigricornis]